MKVLVGKTIYPDGCVGIGREYEVENVEEIINIWEKWSKERASYIEQLGSELWEKGDPEILSIHCNTKEEFLKAVKIIRKVEFPAAVGYEGSIEDIRELAAKLLEKNSKIEAVAGPKVKETTSFENFFKMLGKNYMLGRAILNDMSVEVAESHISVLNSAAEKEWDKYKQIKN